MHRRTREGQDHRSSYKLADGIRVEPIWNRNGSFDTDSAGIYGRDAPGNKPKSVWQNFPGLYGGGMHGQEYRGGHGRDGYISLGDYDHVEEKRGFLVPKHSPSLVTHQRDLLDDSRQGGSHKMFSQQSLQLLNDFLVGDRRLDSSSIEQILLPPRTLQLYSQREELRKLLQSQLDRESQRISEDIDSFVQALQRLFEEIKKILVSKVMQCEFEFKQGILNFTQTVDRYLKESHAALIEDKKRNQYFSLNEDLNYSRTGSIDGVKDLANHRRQMEMADHALKLIRNYRKSHQIVEATELIDSSLQSDKHVYQRSTFRRLFGDFRDEIIRQIEDMDLFKDGNVVKKLNLSLSTAASGTSGQGNTQNTGSRPTPPAPKRVTAAPARQGPFIPLYQGLATASGVHGRHGMLNDSNFDDPSYVEALEHENTENSILTRDKPINQKISSNPLKPHVVGKEGGRFNSHPPPVGGMRDSLTANKLRKENLEERERNFREITKKNIWSSQSDTRSGHLERNRYAGSFDNAERVQAPPEDNGSWNFFESVKRGFFGTGA